LDFQWTVCPG